MKTLLRIGKAVADANRLRTLRALQSGELCVCQITELLAVSTPTVSRHLAILEAAGLVESRKDGRWVYYRLPETPAAPVARTLAWLEHMFADLEDNDEVARLAAIRAAEVEDLCRRQRPN